MKINNFPTEICQALEGNSANLKNNILSSNSILHKNRYIPTNNNTIDITIIVEGSNLTRFENFFRLSIYKTNTPFYANFYFSPYNNSNRDNIYMFNGGYTSKHMSNNIYKITFNVILVQ